MKHVILFFATVGVICMVQMTYIVIKHEMEPKWIAITKLTVVLALGAMLVMLIHHS